LLETKNDEKLFSETFTTSKKKVSKIPSTSSRKEENLKRKNNYFKRGKKMWLKFSQIK